MPPVTTDDRHRVLGLRSAAAPGWSWLLAACLLDILPPGHGSSRAADQPQLGHAWSRNVVSQERGLPDYFDPGSGSNVVWTAELGTESHATPVIAGGRVYIGTNNGRPRDPKHKGDRGVLLCLDEKSGELLWQLVSPKLTGDIYLDWPNSGICSAPTVEGERVYVVNNRAEVLCLDARGMANGNDGPFKDEGGHMTPEGEKPITPGPTDADIIWKFDLWSQAGIWPHDGAHSSVLILGNHLYLNTGTGVDNTHRVIRTPDAPSLVVLDKTTGAMISREPDRIAPDIFHATWSCPAMGTLAGRETIVFAAGNGMVYGFEPLPPGAAANKPLHKLWSFYFDPAGVRTNVHQFVSNRQESPSVIHGSPVVLDGRIYVAGGGDLWWGKKEEWVKCYEVSRELGAEPQLRWEYPLEKHVMATPAVSEGMVFIGDCGGKFHCVDPTTGKAFWTHPIKGQAWGSALVADGKVYAGTRGGMLYVFDAARVKNLRHTIPLQEPMSATPVAANGKLYIATAKRLLAVGNTAKPKGEGP
jgi:outer membrane protein assembly factor BamB